jgi:hypothetical protein
MPLFFQLIKNLKEATKDYTITPMDIFAPKRTGLKENDFELLDTQFMNDTVKRYGAIEITKKKFDEILVAGLNKKCIFKI